MTKKNGVRQLIHCVLAVLLLTALLSPGIAQAADEDFSVEYDFSPDLTGYKGGNIQLLLAIQNTGAADITSINVVINLQAGYSQSWSGIIKPGLNQTLAFQVPFTEADVNVVKLLQVSMNNDTDANPDGLKVFRFQIDGTRDIFDVSTSLEPESSVYHPGDTVEFCFTFSNNFEAHAATGFLVTAVFTDETDRPFADFPRESKGVVMPGGSTDYRFSYTFLQDDVGSVYVHYIIEFTIVETNYHLTNWTKHFEVAQIAVLPGFTLIPETASPGEPTPENAAPTATPDVTPVPESATPNATPATQSATPAATPEQSAAPSHVSETPAATALTQQPEGIPTTALLVLIAILLVAVIVLCALLLRKKK